MCTHAEGEVESVLPSVHMLVEDQGHKNIFRICLKETSAAFRGFQAHRHRRTFKFKHTSRTQTQAGSLHMSNYALLHTK